MSRENFYVKPNQEKIDEVKLELCRALYFEIIYAHCDYQGIANKLGTSPANVSRVMNKRIANLTINQLFRYLAILNPRFRVLISQR